MSWWGVLKTDYRNDLSAILENFPQENEAQVEMDYGRDFCCENARARIVEFVESKGRIVISTGKQISGKEAAERIAEYDCNKLRRFLELSLSKNKMGSVTEEAKQILEDWKDCEGDKSGY